MEQKKESNFGKYLGLYFSKFQGEISKPYKDKWGIDIFQPFKFVWSILISLWVALFEKKDKF